MHSSGVHTQAGRSLAQLEQGWRLGVQVTQYLAAGGGVVGQVVGQVGLLCCGILPLRSCMNLHVCVSELEVV